MTALYHVLNRAATGVVVLTALGAGAQSPSHADAEGIANWAPFHLTARPWAPLEIAPEAYLDRLEGVVRAAAEHVNADGAFIDPVLEREHQYSTPYFAYAAGVLLSEGRISDLRPVVLRAMDHATEDFAGGNAAIPDQHGEFYIAPLAEAVAFFEGIAPEDQLDVWQERVTTPLRDVIESRTKKTNNWRTYAMKGEWLRAAHGYAKRAEAVAFVEDGWTRRTQRERMAATKYHLYQDWNGDPQSHAVEAVGRGNLLGLVHGGYDGPSAEAMARYVDTATEVSLLLQDPTGQCPPNGRTDNHVFNDVLYQLIFEAMAERESGRGSAERAGRYRRAAQLAFQSAGRWERHDGKWDGFFSITKNHFDPAQRIGYQPASQVGNYTGAVLFHLAEAFRARQSAIPEVPAPAEVGGYTAVMDMAFGSAVANAGGMQVFMNLRGDTVPKYGIYWTPLGITRFSRPGWESRLGPSDGHYAGPEGEGVTFGPTWKLRGEWVRLAEMADHYRGVMTTTFAHPLLVKCRVLYAPVTGVGGPNFVLDLTIVPDGVYVEAWSPHDVEFGLTFPLLEDDGRSLETRVDGAIAATQYPDGLGNGDEQCFIGLNDDGVALTEGPRVQSTYGWLRAVRYEAEGDVLRAFVYPRNASDPPAEAVANSFDIREDGIGSALFTVRDRMYRGRYAAGGEGDGLNLDDDGEAELRFDKACAFVADLVEGRVTRVEADRPVSVTVDGVTKSIGAFSPEGM